MSAILVIFYLFVCLFVCLIDCLLLQAHQDTFKELLHHCYQLLTCQYVQEMEDDTVAKEIDKCITIMHNIGVCVCVCVVRGEADLHVACLTIVH